MACVWTSGWRSVWIDCVGVEPTRSAVLLAGLADRPLRRNRRASGGRKSAAAGGVFSGSGEVVSAERLVGPRCRPGCAVVAVVRRLFGGRGVRLSPCVPGGFSRRVSVLQSGFPVRPMRCSSLCRRPCAGCVIVGVVTAWHAVSAGVRRCSGRQHRLLEELRPVDPAGALASEAFSAPGWRRAARAPRCRRRVTTEA